MAMSLSQSQYPDSKNVNSVEEGLRFQDWIMQQAYLDYGFVLQINSSAKSQLQQGESIQRFEVKLDNWCTKTYRLSIEIAEKSKTSNLHWVKSGIFSSTNPSFYIQGNYEKYFVFVTSRLIEYYQVRLHEQFDEKPTVRTFYLPFKIAEQLCIPKRQVISPVLSFDDRRLPKQLKLF